MPISMWMSMCMSFAVTDAAMNCTGEPVCEQSTSGCRGTIASGSGSRRQLEGAAELGCATHLTGIFCQLCDRNNATGPVYYVAATDTTEATCKLCDMDTLGPFMALVAGAAAAVIATVLLFYVCHKYCLSAQRKQQLARAWKTYNLGVKAKVGQGCRNRRVMWPDCCRSLW